MKLYFVVLAVAVLGACSSVTSAPSTFGHGSDLWHEQMRRF